MPREHVKNTIMSELVFENINQTKKIKGLTRFKSKFAVKHGFLF